MKNYILDILGRIFMVIVLLTYWFFALLALPWAWVDSMGGWGFTTMTSWKEGWLIYNADSFRGFFKALFAPLGKDSHHEEDF